MFEIWIFGTARRPKIEAPDQQCSLGHKNSQNQEQHTAFVQENCATSTTHRQHYLAEGNP
jgi:hypothetical protein